MLISTEIEITLHSRNIRYYENKGYKIPKEKDINNKLVVKKGTKIKVNIRDLMKKSHTEVEVKCDCCGEVLKLEWVIYSKYVKSNGKYYCNKCAYKLYGKSNAKKSRLLKSTSFAQWGINNLGKDFIKKYWGL